MHTIASRCLQPVSSDTTFVPAPYRSSFLYFCGSLTMTVHRPSIVIEQATSSYSFRSPELSQPI